MDWESNGSFKINPNDISNAGTESLNASKSGMTLVLMNTFSVWCQTVLVVECLPNYISSETRR